jgi:hypothetical protein
MSKERQRRWRLRRKLGTVVIPVEIDGDCLDLLVRAGVISEYEADTCHRSGGRERLGYAISLWLHQSAQR